MKSFTALIIAVISSFFVCSAQTDLKGQFPAGLVYGPKGAYKIDAPKKWILDNTSGGSMGLSCVLYIDGYTWQNSPVVMYAKIASTSFEDIDKFIEFAIKEYKKEDVNFFHKELKKGKIYDKKYIIMDYHGGLYNNYERVFYIQMEKAVGYVVFSARNEEDFKKFSGSIIEVAESFQYKPEYIGFNEKK